MQIEKSEFGTTKDGMPAQLYTLTNDNGMVAKITNYGGIITELCVPDREDKPGDVVLGFDRIGDYEEKSPFFGCIVGRYANRIAQGRFTLDEKEYTLAVNNGPNHIHGGVRGFDKQVWQPAPFETEGAVGLKLHYLSPDGEEGYPGNLDVTVTYTLTNANELKIDYEATTDKPTIVNLTNHSYFNLAGHAAGTEAMLAHEMMIHADNFTPADENSIPTGRIRTVKDTPMDFMIATPIGDRIEDNCPQLKFGAGYDHNWVLNKKSEGSLSLTAKVVEPTTGRVMEVLTSEPGVQFYTANFLKGISGKDGAVYPRRSGFCLETQHYPDSPNKPNFPSTVLRPGQRYESTTIYKFSVK